MSRMKAPKSGVRVRMYRQGQGDCFLLAFPREGGTVNNPVYLLIDCGYMGGSQFSDVAFHDVIDHIAETTGGFIDYVAITHEHADHVNGFNRRGGDGNRLFDQITFGQLWLAWTEDGTDDDANNLRDRFNDTLVALALAEDRIAASDLDPAFGADVAHLLEVELGPKADRQALAATLKAQNGAPFGAVDGITNKTAIKYLRDTAQSGPEFLTPEQDAFAMDGTTGAQVYVLGPPRDEKLLTSLDPQGDEEFHIGSNFALSGEAAAFNMAIAGGGGLGDASPFAKRYATPEDEVFAQPVTPPDQFTPSEAEELVRDYNATVYCEALSGVPQEDWRRIDGDWLRAAGAMALRLNHEVNNTSLVLAFALPNTGKVLLFTGDAQRGNWISWSDLEWGGDDGPVTAKDLLGRCVFYKCGHHGSHNATLDGKLDSDHANLSWFAQGPFAQDFVAMIPVHSAWAKRKNGWNHPLPSIHEALMKKARGRVMRNDRARVQRPRPGQGHGKLTDAEWDAFKDLSIEAKLYKEYIVLDE